ncbi:MAG: hypothetical protein WCI51_11415 [Lentisphaerota bacterium]
MKLKNENHRQLLDKLEATIDLEHVARTEQLQNDLWNGGKMPYLPCVAGLLPSGDWPSYTFTERWDDVEKNIINSLGWVYSGALLKDDRLYQIRPEYGVVNIPELFGIETIISNEGNSMSEGLNDRDKLKRLIDAGVPDFASCRHTLKIFEYQDTARELLSDYEKLSKVIHFTLPDTQGPFDLACLIWGSDIYLGLHDEPELFEQLMDLVTRTFVEYNKYHQKRMGDPVDSAYHIAGLKLVNGGIRICDDSATLISKEMYASQVAPYNVRAFAPFSGGWLHYCGDGNRLLPTMLNDIPGVHAIHLGNPDLHNFRQLVKDLAERKIVLFWSGALEELPVALQESPDARMLVLLENRYAPKSFDDAKWRLEQVRKGLPVPKASW